MFNSSTAVASGNESVSPAAFLRMVTIGLHGGSVGYQRALAHPGFRVSDDAYEALSQLPYASVEQMVYWAVVTPAMVGLGRGGTYDEFITAASEAWEFLMPEAAPAIRLQNRQRIAAQCLLVATSPIMLRKEAHLFSVCQDEDDDWLRLGLPTHHDTMHYDAEQPFALMSRVAA